MSRANLIERPVQLLVGEDSIQREMIAKDLRDGRMVHHHQADIQFAALGSIVLGEGNLTRKAVQLGIVHHAAQEI